MDNIFPKYKPIIRRFQASDPFFEEGNIEFTKQTKTVDEDIDFIIDSIGAVHIEEFTCTVKGCLQKFTNPLQFNRHFDMVHRFRCEHCQKHCPSNYLLSLHLQENHDAYFDVQKEKGVAVYQCILESCIEIFKSEEERKKHLVKIHKYPADFRFNAIKRKHNKYQTSRKINSNKVNFTKNAKTEKLEIKENISISDKKDNGEEGAMEVDKSKTNRSKSRNKERSTQQKASSENNERDISECATEDVQDTNMDLSSDGCRKKKVRKPRKNKKKEKVLSETSKEFIKDKELFETGTSDSNNDKISTQSKESISCEKQAGDIMEDDILSNSNMGTNVDQMETCSPSRIEYKRSIPKSISFGRGVQKGFSRARRK